MMLLLLLLFPLLTWSLSFSNKANNHNMFGGQASSSSSSSSFRFEKDTIKPNVFSISNADLCAKLNESPIPKLLENLLKEESLSIVLESLRASDNIIDGLWLTGYHLSSSTFKNSTSHLIELNSIPSIDAIVRLPTLSENKNTNEYIEYNHVIYPRRLCHRLLSVREKICEELIEDLRFIVNENIDIKKSGLSRSFEYKKLFIDVDEEHSTKFRKLNFKKLNQVITNEVINIVRKRLSTTPSQLSYLDSHIEKNYDYNNYLQDESVPSDEVSSSHMKLLSTTILGVGEEPVTIEPFHNNRTPFNFLSSLYAEGELKGLERQSDGSFINKLKIARDILDLRESISEYVGHVIDREQRAILKSFRSIKDSGGLKFDDREEVTPLFKKSDFTNDMATAWIEEGLNFGIIRSKAITNNANNANNNNNNECSTDFFPCPEDSNKKNPESNSDETSFGSHNTYGNVMLM